MKSEVLEYFVKRLFLAFVIIFLVTLFVFWLCRVVPGDPATMIAHPGASPEAIENLREQLGLNKPFLPGYIDYMWGVFHGDLGISYRYLDRTVAELLFPAMWVSFQLNFDSMLIWLPLGLIVGVIAALKHKRWIDPAIINATLLFYVIPSLILIQVMILFFGLYCKVLPVYGFEGMFSKEIIIPALTLAVGTIAGLALFVRTNILGTLQEGKKTYLLFAKAKGLTEKRIFLRHIFPNAFSPVITQLIPVLFLLVAGTFFVELIYGIPGAGRLMINSILGSRDYNVITGFVIITTFLFMFANLVADVFYAILDPRVTLGRRR